MARTALAALIVVGVYVGWEAFWFLTDDAFIAFRYVSNSMLGHGWVWNPAPFVPVEGYSSFLWVVLLELVWRATGVMPPEAANWLSLGFGYATLFIGARMLNRLSLPPELERWRLALLALVLFGTITNRTFLTWLSSGLETSLFVFSFTAWTAIATTPPHARRPAWLRNLALATVATALTRPDGLLVLMATLLLLGVDAAPRLRSGSARFRDFAWGLALLAVPLHVVWRRLEYGAWLPNTYFAKQVGMWPESGIRYLFCFVFENGAWFWLLLLAAAATIAVRRGTLTTASIRQRPSLWIAVATVVAHAGYYTFVTGGDHFEYRVYAHLVMLLFVSGLCLATRIVSRPALVAGLVAAFIALSWPIQWVHWLETRELTSRRDSYILARSIAHRFPSVLQGPVRFWDDQQRWLIEHFVGMRHQEHKVFAASQLAGLPTREIGAKITWASRKVLPLATVGVPGWVFPEVAILDLYGLNDRVIARQPPSPARERMMAHDRLAPLGYLECFRPNMTLSPSYEVQWIEGQRPISDDEIRECERHFFE